MIGSPKPTAYESLMPPAVNPLLSTHQIPSTRPSPVAFFERDPRCPLMRSGFQQPLKQIHNICATQR